MTVSVKLEACELAECAKVAYESIQNIANMPGDRADDIDDLEATAKQIKDSGLPQSFVECIPKLDAVVSLIDQVAEVCLLTLQRCTHTSKPWIVSSISKARLERDRSRLQGKEVMPSLVLYDCSCTLRSFRTKSTSSNA